MLFCRSGRFEDREVDMWHGQGESRKQSQTNTNRYGILESQRYQELFHTVLESHPHPSRSFGTDPSVRDSQTTPQLCSLPFVGPYWVSVQYGPFTASELGVCIHKVSNSADFTESTKAIARLEGPPIQHHLYLLGTNESTAELERVISSTDGLAHHLIVEAAQYHCMCIFLSPLTPPCSNEDYRDSVAHCAVAVAREACRTGIYGTFAL